MHLSGRTVLKFYFKKMLDHEQGVIDTFDVDHVHDMRVASRRSRTAFRVLRQTFGSKEIAPFLKQFKRVGLALGSVRDFDVFLEFMDEYGEECERSDAPGVVALRDHLESEREVRRHELVDCLTRSSYRQFKLQYANWLNGSVKIRLKKSGRKVSRVVVPKILAGCGEEVLDFDETVRFDPSPEAYHDLRIACKHMRYSAEFFRSCYGKRLNNVMRLMTKIQDDLGRVHDADMHVDYISGYISTLDRRSSTQRSIQSDFEELIDSETDLRKDYLGNFYAVWPEALEELRGLDLIIKK